MPDSGQSCSEVYCMKNILSLEILNYENTVPFIYHNSKTTIERALCQFHLPARLSLHNIQKVASCHDLHNNRRRRQFRVQAVKLHDFLELLTNKQF